MTKIIYVKRISSVPVRAEIDEFGKPFILRKHIEEDISYCGKCNKRLDGRFLNYCDNCGEQLLKNVGEAWKSF